MASFLPGREEISGVCIDGGGALSFVGAFGLDHDDPSLHSQASEVPRCPCVSGSVWWDWYASLLWIERRKCLMFTQAETLFTFMVLDVRKAEVLPLGAFFVARLHSELASEGLPADTFGEIDPESVAIATTASRSVLGSMNNLAYLAEWAIMDFGGVRYCNIEELNKSLRRTPMGAIGGAYGLDGAESLGKHASARALGSNVIRMPARSRQ